MGEKFVCAIKGVHSLRVFQNRGSEENIWNEEERSDGR
jgi:hypothetical protein